MNFAQHPIIWYIVGGMVTSVLWVIVEPDEPLPAGIVLFWPFVMFVIVPATAVWKLVAYLRRRLK
jgi:hypothetical protein